MKSRLRLFLRMASFGRGVNIDLAELDHNGLVCAYATSATFQRFDQGAEILPEDSLATISKEAAQNLLDELWFLGFRPEHGDVDNSTAAATKAHLQDMRAIVFHKLEINKP